MKTEESLRDIILEESKNGNIVVSGFEGLQVMSLKECIEQPTDGLLYDLNRNESVVLTFIDDPKWVNDFAVAKTIRALKQRIFELESQLKEMNTNDDTPQAVRDWIEKRLKK